MPSIIDPQTIHVDELPAIWSPVQWELTEEERVEAVNEQATASLLWTMDAPEAILRLLELLELFGHLDPAWRQPLERAVAILRQDRQLQVLSHSRVPSNDGGIALGQALIGAARMLQATAD